MAYFPSSFPFLSSLLDPPNPLISFRSSQLQPTNKLNHRKVWRPIAPIHKSPLAVADATSVPDSDLVGAPLIYPNRAGETYAVKANPSHRWYFKYGQRPEEVMLIKCFDSLNDGRARRVPHSAFVNPAEDGEEWKGRESIEVRCLVFYDY